MSKKIIIKEDSIKSIIINNILEENKIDKQDIVSAVKDAIKNDINIKSDIDKKVREIVASTINTLFKTLWQRRNFYEDEIKRG